LRYKIALSDSSGSLGWWAYVHVDPAGVFYGNGAQLTSGSWIGKTKKYEYSLGCWEVSTNEGVHWHIVGFNNHNYSCYPPYAAGSFIAQNWDMVGAVGANGTSSYRGCW
jgi:hypothetical protein